MTQIRTFQRDNKLAWRSNELSKGEFVVISVGKTLIVGCVLNFQKANEKKKCCKVFTNEIADMKKFANLKFYLDPIYEINRNFSITQKQNNHD